MFSKSISNLETIRFMQGLRKREVNEVSKIMLTLKFTVVNPTVVSIVKVLEVSKGAERLTNTPSNFKLF